MVSGNTPTFSAMIEQRHASHPVIALRKDGVIVWNSTLKYAQLPGAIFQRD